jgi:hypothetical protein
MAVVFILPERRHRTLVQVLGTVVVLAVLVGVAVWRTQQIQALLASIGVV